MFRSDIYSLIPALLIALFQVKVIWKFLPETRIEDTEIEGEYKKGKLVIYLLINIAYIVLFLQFFFHIFTVTDNSTAIFFLRLLGYTLIILGFIESLLALQALGNNWTGLVDYRIKKGQTLVTHGIFGYVRHPIYSAVLLEMTGYQLLVNSWTFLGVLIPLYAFFYYHIQLEERLLFKKYNGEYKKYKSKTKSILPFWI